MSLSTNERDISNVDVPVSFWLEMVGVQDSVGELYANLYKLGFVACGYHSLSDLLSLNLVGLKEMFHNPEFVEGIAFQKLEKLHETSMTNAFKRLLRPGGAGAVRREYSESRFASNVIVTGLTNLSGNTPFDLHGLGLHSSGRVGLYWLRR